VRLCLEWCERNEHPVELTRVQIQQYAAELIAANKAELIAAGKEASTVRLRLAALRQFARWLVSEGELPEDQLLGIKPPKIPIKPVTASPTSCCALSLRRARVRASETVSLNVADVQPLKNGVVAVRRGKGMKGPVARLSLTLVFCEDFHIFHSCRVKLDGRRLM
jgi:site-specific recombinase XerD